MFETQFIENAESRLTSLIGVDEVGRGPLAGPVVACSVKLNLNYELETLNFLEVLRSLNVTDSKKLSKVKRREILSALEIPFRDVEFEKVYSIAGVVSFSVAEVSPKLIDEINIHHASLKAMSRSLLKGLIGGEEQALILIDGKWAPKHQALSKHCIETVIKGDSKSLVIALASIIAKEKRDSIMEELSVQFPNYGLQTHSGYPTPFHKKMIREHGPSSCHRITFKGVKDWDQKNEKRNQT
ncbi:MAG: ribonuclease HII [Bacteriovoracaceae bacterium]